MNKKVIPATQALILPHGEKDAGENGSLTEKGANQALAAAKALGKEGLRHNNAAVFSPSSAAQFMTADIIRAELGMKEVFTVNGLTKAELDEEFGHGRYDQQTQFVKGILGLCKKSAAKNLIIVSCGDLLSSGMMHFGINLKGDLSPSQHIQRLALYKNGLGLNK